MCFNTVCRKALKTPGFSMVWEHGLGVQSHESTKSMWKPKVVRCFFCATDFCHGAQNGTGAQKSGKLDGFHNFLCKKQKNSMLFTTFYAKIKKTRWFCPLFCAPGDDLARLTGAQNGPDAKKTKKTKCCSLLFMEKKRKLNGFAYFLVPPSTTSPGSPGSLSTAATISKSNENTMFFNTFCRKAVKT